MINGVHFTHVQCKDWDTFVYFSYFLLALLVLLVLLVLERRENNKYRKTFLEQF